MNSNTKRYFIFAIILVVFYAATSFYTNGYSAFRHSPNRYIQPKIKALCVLSNSSQIDSINSFLAAVRFGHWVRFPPPAAKLRELMSFVDWNRHTHHNITRSLQRPDGKCGNIAFVPKGQYRALCNPTGPTPCCYHNKCVDRDEAQCACAQCLDSRTQDLHAEFAHFNMTDTGHHINPFNSRRDVCDVMSNVTLVLYGDSMVSQIYVALLTKALGGKMNVPPDVPEDEKVRCQGQRSYHLGCRHYLKKVWEFTDCDEPSSMSAITAKKLSQTSRSQLRDKVRLLTQTPNSVLFVGVGVWVDFNISIVNTTVVQAIREGKGHSRWPFVIFAGNHHWGMLNKPCRISEESVVEKFNRDVKTLVSQYGMAYFDTYEMTRNVFSYDGTHYLEGVNMVKADLLLNVIQKLKRRPDSCLI